MSELFEDVKEIFDKNLKLVIELLNKFFIFKNYDDFYESIFFIE